MAAHPHNHSRVGSRASLGVGFGDIDLPNGNCNFRDLSLGSRAPVCGCTRFWLKVEQAFGGEGGSERAWCFCGHHACFHSAGTLPRLSLEGVVEGSRLGIGQEVGNGSVNGDDMAQRRPETPQKRPSGLGLGIQQPESRQQSQSINTRVWQALNDFARNQEDGASDATSKLPSTNAPSLVEEPRLSPNRMIQDRLQQYRNMAPPINIPPGPTPRPPEEYSATEVATPSIAGTPDFRALASSSGQRVSPGHLNPGRIEARQTEPDPIYQPEPVARPATAPAPEVQPTNAAFRGMSSQELQDILRVYGQRIEVLESLSFSQVPVEELQERFELFDGRILDLEHWRTEQEQIRHSPEPQPGSSKRRRLLPTEGSFGSDASFDSSAAAHTEAAVLATLAANAETHPRIDALESRVSDLESATMPSFARPWQVQVVLLPWGRDLRGIWFSSTEATQQSMRSTTQVSEEWTGAQSAPKLSFKSSTSGAWTTESIQAWAKDAQEWLSPKACGPTGTVFQRLASRGLVKDVTLTAPDARHIFDSIRNAFSHIDKNQTELDPEDAKNYQGLSESFIPLRKVRKSARLRFLSTAEMVTSATWTAPFLDASVFMKVTNGQRRLYITMSDAYLQPNSEAWSWKKLHDLPIIDASGEEQAAQRDNLAIEACWSYNEQLDYVPSVHSSFGSHESQWSTRSQIAANDNDTSDQDPPISPRSSSLLPRQRTVSLPSSSSGNNKLRDLLPKRRIASFEPVATIPIHAEESGVEIIAKRRRISHSPELERRYEAERRGVGFTPRLSREPPSPFTSDPPPGSTAEGQAEARSQATSSRKRGNTPFAYATPHSHSHYINRLEYLGDGGDTEADTDLYADRSERASEYADQDQEWEGVEEDEGSTRSEAGSVEMAEGKGLAEGEEDDELDVEGMELYAP